MNTTDTILGNVLRFWKNHALPSNTKVIVGVSGGTDSLALLHALGTLRGQLGLELHVATLDHCLRGAEGASDADFVMQVAHDWGVAATQGKTDVQQLVRDYGINIEEAARQARYSFFLNVAQDIDAEYIAVAHNHDDQAETILMHLIRGAGLHGLRGMLPVTPFSEYHLFYDEEDDDFYPEDFTLIRPFLDTSRTLIKQYCIDHQLTPREDVTNEDVNRFRNSLRHDLMPRLLQMNPNIRGTLNRLGEVVRGEVEVLESRVESVAAWLLEWVETQPLHAEDEGGEAVYLDRENFAEQPLAIQRGIIRKMIFDISPHTRDLSYEQTEHIRDLLLDAPTGMHLDLPDGLYLSIGYDEAMIGYGGMPYYPDYLPSLVQGQYVAIDLNGQGYIHGNQRLTAYWIVEGLSQDLYPADPLECTLAIPENAKLALRTRRDGDRFRPFGMKGKSQKLSDTFTNLKVPSYYRDQVPLLTVDDEIAWFVVPTATGPIGRIAESFAVRPDSQSILRVRWQIGEPQRHNEGMG